MYHINPKTGLAGRCRAQVQCPFGGPDEHFSDADEARRFFEDRMTAHKFHTAKKAATGNRSIVALPLRLSYTTMMARRTAEAIGEDVRTEAVLLTTQLGVKEKLAGPRGGSLMESVKRAGEALKALRSLTRLPFVQSSAVKLIGSAGSAAALLSPTGLAIGGGVAAVGGVVAASYFGKKAFEETKETLLRRRPE